MTDPFAVLGLSQGATPEQVKRAYRRQVKKWHPDQFSSEPEALARAEEKIKEINAAYEALSNPDALNFDFNVPTGRPPVWQEASGWDPATGQVAWDRAAWSGPISPAPSGGRRGLLLVFSGILMVMCLVFSSASGVSGRMSALLGAPPTGLPRPRGLVIITPEGVECVAWSEAGSLPWGRLVCVRGENPQVTIETVLRENWSSGQRQVAPVPEQRWVLTFPADNQVNFIAELPRELAEGVTGYRCVELWGSVAFGSGPPTLHVETFTPCN